MKTEKSPIVLAIAESPIAESPLADNSSPGFDDARLLHYLAKYGLVHNRKSGYVEWRPDNPDHPRNWTAKRKAYDILVVLFFELFT